MRTVGRISSFRMLLSPRSPWPMKYTYAPGPPAAARAIAPTPLSYSASLVAGSTKLHTVILSTPRRASVAATARAVTPVPTLKIITAPHPTTPSPPPPPPPPPPPRRQMNISSSQSPANTVSSSHEKRISYTAGSYLGTSLTMIALTSASLSQFMRNTFLSKFIVMSGIAVGGWGAARRTCVVVYYTAGQPEPPHHPVKSKRSPREVELSAPLGGHTTSWGRGICATKRLYIIERL